MVRNNVRLVIRKDDLVKMRHLLQYKLVEGGKSTPYNEDVRQGAD